MSATGLTTIEAARRLAEHGKNELAKESGPNALAVLLRQFKGTMFWLLVGAVGLAIALGEEADAIAIAVIVTLNTAVGFYQEYRAERAMSALATLAAPRARVLRDGATVSIIATEVVPGDVLVLEAGDVVAADARLLEANALRTNEASLTGESQPVDKRVSPAAIEAPLAERIDSVFMGTTVVGGTGQAEVCNTGHGSELGKIAGLLATTRREETPLQKRLEHVGRILAFACVAIVVMVAVTEKIRGRAWGEIILGSISLAVAAVPEGLATIVTIALAVGVQRVAAQRVIVRRLPAVEALGSCTVICTDKTGTLTTGIMTVREVVGDPAAVLAAAAACCDAELAKGEAPATGDPTEIALLVAAAKHTIERGKIEADNARVTVVPFDSDRKRMSILRADGHLYLKGAPEVVLPLCTSGADGAAQTTAALGERGLRVLAIAVGDSAAEQGLRLLGLVGLADPPRPEAIAAIAEARRAGIRTVMITGDHPATATAISRELGLFAEGEDPAQWVRARATASDKLTIVRDWKAKGAVVAMTGDGVNDAPALREAHVGIAMGDGTEVTRESADLILSDNNYASIVNATREGRGIFENIRRTLVYVLTGNSSELLVMLGALMMGWPVPLLPLHLLWMNLLTETLPALALVVEPAREDLMDRPPRPPDSPMLGRVEWRRVALAALLEATLALALYAWAREHRDLAEARSLAFSALVCSMLLRSFAARSETQTFPEMGALTNLRLLAVVVTSIAVQVGIHHVTALRDLLYLGHLPLRDALMAFAIGAIPVTAIELRKLGSRALRRKAAPAPSAV